MCSHAENFPRSHEHVGVNFPPRFASVAVAGDFESAEVTRAASNALAEASTGSE